jgi:hypothetical protein
MGALHLGDWEMMPRMRFRDDDNVEIGQWHFG